MGGRRGMGPVAMLVAGGWLVANCGGGTTDPPPPPPVTECTDTVQVSVTLQDTLPLVSWTPDCMVGRILIVEGIDEYWGSETCGMNTYRTPILYDHNPPDTCPEEPARPLERGHTYHVTLYRWVTYTPVESLQVVGEHDFTR